MGRQARPKMPKDLIDKFRRTGPKKRKPMIPLRKKGAKGAPTAANFARAKQTARKR